MAAPMERSSDGNKNVESKQLLYSDAFGQCYQEERLRIVGKPKAKAPDHLQTFSIPQSSVLSQIKSFLPRLSDANMKMVQEIESHPEKAEQINIECLDDGDGDDDDIKGKHIEMNISLIPTQNDGTPIDGSDDDESSDDGGEDEEDVINDNDGSQGDSAKESPTVSLDTKDGGLYTQNNLERLKLPSSSNKKQRKQKPNIEEIKGQSSTFEEESTHR